ncbi:DUF5708 family protein [Streptomyces sp. RFCAC02]|uniref:DUF5708 family protein n=1 Tax=Streptomyces sp. RFCAC02 TaxID=2499143 RepID=UPI00101E8F57|nr:DUF5708 family protein [Streptomyces sp. RFCAC02]
MSPATKNLAEGAVTLLVGLALRLFAGGVDTPVVSLTKVGVVLMVLGGVLICAGLFHTARATGTRR